MGVSTKSDIWKNGRVSDNDVLTDFMCLCYSNCEKNPVGCQNLSSLNPVEHAAAAVIASNTISLSCKKMQHIMFFKTTRCKVPARL